MQKMLINLNWYLNICTFDSTFESTGSWKQFELISTN